MDLILSSENMNAAWKHVKSNKGASGVDNTTIEDFPDYLRNKWSKIKQALLLGYYVPSPVLKVEIPKKSGGKRKLGIPMVNSYCTSYNFLSENSLLLQAL